MELHRLQIERRTRNLYLCESCLSEKTPLIILKTGSKPVDVRSNRFVHSFVRCMLQYGISVLCYSDRGVEAGRDELYYDSTLSDFGNDLAVIATWTQEKLGERFTKYGFCGHSMGGIVALLGANRSEHIDFVITLASPFAGMRINALYQRCLPLKSEPKQILRATWRYYERLGQLLESNEPLDPLYDLYSKLEDAKRQCDRPSDRVEEYREKFEAQNTQFSRRYYYSEYRVDIEEAIKELQCPLYALFGQNDQIIYTKRNVRSVEQMASTNGKLLTSEVVADVDHMFSIEGNNRALCITSKKIAEFCEHLSD